MGNYMAYLNLGTSLIALGRCQEAASVLREGSRLDGTGLRDRIAHENARIASLLQLGGLYADQGKLQRALAVYREALHTLPDTYPPQPFPGMLKEMRQDTFRIYNLLDGRQCLSFDPHSHK
uniref:Uncharacterized protein n=1 Tax=Phlebotomus papatasi TaxID=29031 RepID=A0A1B0GPD2_PHLPP